MAPHTFTTEWEKPLQARALPGGAEGTWLHEWMRSSRSISLLSNIIHPLNGQRMSYQTNHEEKTAWSEFIYLAI